MKKEFKWIILSMLTVCLSLNMLSTANSYSAKAENNEVNEIVVADGEADKIPLSDLKSAEEEAREATEVARLAAEAERQSREAARKAEEEAARVAAEKRVAAENAKKEERKKAEEKKKEEEAKKKTEEAKKKEEADKNAYNIKMSAKDKENLYRLVQSEVGYMDEKSKIYVASVVLNRVKHKSFPNTVTGVVLAHNPRTGVYQFSPVKPGGRFWRCKVSDSTRKAVDKVLKNGDYSNGAIAFVAKRYTTYRAASWFDNTLHHLFHHNGQDYYRYR